MVKIEYDRDTGARCFVLRPNAACNWRQSARLFAVLAVICLTVAAGFAAMGYWPILPFAGIEVGALGAALYVTARRGHEAEVVRIGDRSVEIEKGRRRPERRWLFERTWCEVVLSEPRHRWYPRRLAIRSGGEQVELGRFLGEEELEMIAVELRYWVGPMAGAGPAPAAAASGVCSA
jgi:uncharacterized membrane protein